ncbi:hypothetical protein EVJ58_g3640 [Rhodofomes roseus]|uniref:Aminotransferase class I/classII large domain-containing protein n=1 Tax=Rhodofomes roseus TaxID=34475 RepID=A0A4Y9YJU7_9APHY|nr:hypothetical protein EVJ58_g3640 [Rhodofomes roseus]
MQQELSEYLENAFSLTDTDLTYGDGLTGSARLSGALSTFLNAYFRPHRPVLSDHLFIGAGVMSLLDQVVSVLADPGDGVLISVPYYPGFDPCITLHNGVVPVGAQVPLDKMLTLGELDYLEDALRAATRRGVSVKAVLLCNPHNPLARCYPREVVEAYCQFCERHGLHLLADEPFYSVLALDADRLGVNPARLHVLYGMSKDFLANGLRAAVLVSQANPDVLQSLLPAAPFMVVASPTAVLWATLLEDKSFLTAFLAENSRRLFAAYERTAAWLAFHGIPHAPASAGHFLLADFRPVLVDVARYGAALTIHAGHTLEERERALATHLLARGVAVMPGTACHLTEGGWFRLTFALREEQMRVAFRRIEDALGWDNWQPRRSDIGPHL